MTVFVIMMHATKENEEISIHHRVVKSTYSEARDVALADTRRLVNENWLIERVEIKEVGRDE